jgi:hypothetical protein
VKNASYNGSLGAGASTTFGFTASGTNPNAPGNLRQDRDPYTA